MFEKVSLVMGKRGRRAAGETSGCELTSVREDGGCDKAPAWTGHGRQVRARWQKEGA